MNRIQFYNARVITMEEPVCVKENMQLWVIGNKIAYVGDGKNGLESFYEKYGKDTDHWDRKIDCAGNVLLPGFKDAHTHSAMVLFRSMADDEPLQNWLNNLIFPIEGKLTSEEVYELTKLSVLEYLTSGVTGVFEMYLTPESIQDAFTECGMRNVQVSGINNFGPAPEVMEERFLKLNGRNELSSYQLGFHAEYTCTRELLENIAKMAQKYKAPVFAHNSETRQEVEECIGRYGLTPTQLMDELGMFEYGGGGYHCVHFSDKDIEIFQKKKLSVVTNPASNLKLASGIAPISDFLKAGINVAIGTDGAGSNNCLDMFREMFLVTGLAKYHDMDASSVDAVEVLKMATVGGARAMGLGSCETLTEGSLADLILLDLKQPNMQPVNNIVKNIVYSGSKQNVKMTMINGRILYEDGRFDIGCDVNELYEKCNRIAAQFK
ncbi:MAG: amidohydrolase [Lachnospiraceae bacterium]|jgi:5-methylthioadenosine/S-adenosylhomocysteine deaminase|nr:amidohydrolase [Lachnospiraceae bacterium]